MKMLGIVVGSVSALSVVFFVGLLVGMNLGHRLEVKVTDASSPENHAFDHEKLVGQVMGQLSTYAKNYGLSPEQSELIALTLPIARPCLPEEEELFGKGAVIAEVRSQFGSDIYCVIPAKLRVLDSETSFYEPTFAVYHFDQSGASVFTNVSGTLFVKRNDTYKPDTENCENYLVSGARQALLRKIPEHLH